MALSGVPHPRISLSKGALGIWFVEPSYCTMRKIPRNDLGSMALGTEHFLKYGEINPNIWIRPPPRAGGVEGLVPYRRFCISNSQALLKNCMTTGPGSYITIGVLLARHRYLPYSRIQISRAIDKKDAFVEPSVKFLS